MALTFPASPTTGQVYTTANGITYSYNGTSWVAINSTYAIGGFRKLDSIASQFNGSNTTFNLSVSGVSITPGSAQNLNIVIGGVPQEPGVSYTLSNNSIQFSSAPTSGMSFYGVLLGDVMNVGVPSDSTVTSSKLDANINISGTLTSTNVNVSGSLTSSNTTLSGKFVPPTGNTASRPSNPTLGTLYYNTERDAFENYTSQGWLKVSVKTPSVTSIAGTIYSGNTSTLSFSGSGFGAVQGTVNFVSGAVNANATTSSLTDTSATVLVPASIYGLGSGNTVNITLKNSDEVGSGITQKNVQGLPTGGTITYIANNYVVHTFTSSSTLTVPSGFSSSAEFVVIAGGGGGGYRYGAGGAGGYRCSVPGEYSGGGANAESKLAISAGTYTVTIGAGGSGGTNSGSGGHASTGSDTTFGSITSSGGGGGAGGGVSPDPTSSENKGYAGGSGGGGSGNGNNGYNTYASGGSATSGQGYSGGYGWDQSGNNGGGGGGGAGGAGTNAGSANGYGGGGAGVQSSINGTPTYRAGGGGATGQTGGIASGGNGGGGTKNVSSGNGTSNTGGGAASGLDSAGGSGGSGIVIVRYQLP